MRCGHYPPRGLTSRSTGPPASCACGFPPPFGLRRPVTSNVRALFLLSAVRTRHILFIPVWLLLSSCVALTERQRDWELVQFVGGISIGTPTLVDGSWSLPVHCNVAGEQVTRKPIGGHSGLLCSSTTAIVQGHDILLSVRTSLATGTPTKLSSRCPPANLASATPGAYSVYYLDPDNTRHFIANVRLGL